MSEESIAPPEPPPPVTLTEYLDGAQSSVAGIAVSLTRVQDLYMWMSGVDLRGPVNEDRAPPQPETVRVPTVDVARELNRDLGLLDRALLDTVKALEDCIR